MRNLIASEKFEVLINKFPFFKIYFEFLIKRENQRLIYLFMLSS